MNEFRKMEARVEKLRQDMKGLLTTPRHSAVEEQVQASADELRVVSIRMTACRLATESIEGGDEKTGD